MFDIPHLNPFLTLGKTTVDMYLRTLYACFNSCERLEIVPVIEIHHHFLLTKNLRGGEKKIINFGSS